MKNDGLGDRMKGYEAVTSQVLPRRTYTIIRLDGVAFHTLTREMKKPFDDRLIIAMDETATKLCEYIQGVKFAYVQSDEISLLLTDFNQIGTQPWFGGNVQKITSVSASVATQKFNSGIWLDYPAYFDSRVFTIPDPTEVYNYFVWRQKDCVRNSIQALGQSHFSPGELHGRSCEDILCMLSEKDPEELIWNNLPDKYRLGRFIEQKPYDYLVCYTDKRTGEKKEVPVARTHWVLADMPEFVLEPDWLTSRIPTYE